MHSCVAGTTPKSPGEREVESRAFMRRRLRPDASAVPGDDPLHSHEPDARARELADGMQALEGYEELVGVRHVEADAVVADEVFKSVLAGTCAHRHACVSYVCRVLD